MRIISGKFRGKRFIAPSSLPVRPTTDFAKEGLFNILTNYFDFEELSVLDLFAGTGNITYEFISRGTSQIVSIDENRNCTAFIQKSVNALEAKYHRTLNADAIKFIEKTQSSYDIIFADPPFDFDKTNLIPDIVFSRKLLNTDGWLIVEHSKNYKFQDHPNWREDRNYGSIIFSIFENKKQD